MQEHTPIITLSPTLVTPALPTLVRKQSRPPAPVCPACGCAPENADTALQRWLDLSA